MALSAVLAAYEKQELKDYQLRAAVDDEKIRLHSLAALIGDDGDALMKASGFTGETLTDRQAEFTAMTETLAKAETALEVATKMAEAVKSVSSVPATYAKNDDKQPELRQIDDIQLSSIDGVFAQQMLKSQDYQDWHTALQRGIHPDTSFSLKNAMQELRLRHITSSPVGEGIMQRHRVVPAIRPPTRLVDAAGMEIQRGTNYIVFHRIRRPDAAASRNEAVAAEIAKTNVTAPRSPLHFQSIGVIAGVQREYVAANSNLLPRVADALMYDMMEEVNRQANQGTGATQSWTGINKVLTDISGENVTVNTAIQSGETQKNAYLFLREKVGELIDAGVMPNLVMVDRTLADKVFNRVFSNMTGVLNPDYRGQNGEPLVRGVPIWVDPGIASNTAIIGDFNPASVSIVAQNDVEVQFSNEVYFGTNEIAVRVLIYGNLAVYNPLRFRQYTATNILTGTG